MITRVMEIVKRIEDLQNRFGLTPKKNTAVKSYSRISADALSSVDKTKSSVSPGQRADLQNTARELSAGNSVPFALVDAVIKTGSGYDPASVQKGLGLMQLSPKALAGVKNPLAPDDNMKAGIALLKKFLNIHKGDYAGALAAYKNASIDGSTAAEGETKEYVRKVLDTYRRNSIDTLR